MLRFARHFLFCVLLLCTLPLSVFAQSFTVSEIYLENLQRVSSTTIFSVLNVNIGDEITQADIAEIIRNLMATSSFEDVEVTQGANNELIISVTERPSISSVVIEGSKAIPEDVLMENIETLGLSVGELFDPSVLEGLQIAMEGQYVAQGLYGAVVELQVEEQERNRVALQINITEGDPSKIIHINIVGNEAFSDEELLELFELKETHFISFITSDDRYSREAITGDLENLQSFYMDQGYVNFAVTLPVVSLSPNRDQVYITINVDEGEIYRINDVSLAGDLVGTEIFLNQLMGFIQPGQVFSQILITQVAEAMTTTLSNRGYFFAEVNGVPIVNEDDGTVDVTFFVVPGNRTYVNRISFNGNTRTIDEVLRQEMRQMEGAPASANAIEQSKVRLERLGYFSSVEYETSEVGGVTDQINVDFSVEEQLSGSINFSVGFAQVQGLSLSADLQERNFLGTGKQVSVGVNTNAFSTRYAFNYLDPFYTVDGVSRGFGLSYVTSDYAELNLAAYSTNQTNANVNFGYPIGESQFLNFSFAMTSTEIETGFGPVQEIAGSPRLDSTINSFLVQPARLREFTDPGTGTVFPISDAVIAPLSSLPSTAFREITPGFIDREGDSFIDVTLTADWRRNNLLQPGIFATGGSQQSLSVEFAVPGSQLSFYKLRLFGESYTPLNRFLTFLSPSWILHLEGTLGYGDGYGGTEQLPFFRNFYAGGQGTIRGFERNTLGPRSSDALLYRDEPTELLRDSNGNLVLDFFGNAQFKFDSERAYRLAQARDASGNLVFDAAGQPVYENELDTRSLFFGRPQPFGGNIQATGSAELIFPLGPLEARDTLRSTLFVDAGNVFSSYCTDTQISNNNCSNFALDEFRYSVGISVSWFTGYLGLMTFSLAKPFNSSIIDEQRSFQFDIGGNF